MLLAGGNSMNIAYCNDSSANHHYSGMRIGVWRHYEYEAITNPKVTNTNGLEITVQNFAHKAIPMVMLNGAYCL